jgi:hypothetical protein
MPGILNTNSAPTGDVPERAGVYLLTHPRSASNLFQTMMDKQPGYQTSGYKFFGAAQKALLMADDEPLSAKSAEQREELYTAFRDGYKSLLDELADAKSKVRGRAKTIFLFKQGKRKRDEEMKLMVAFRGNIVCAKPVVPCECQWREMACLEPPMTPSIPHNKPR